nr:MAG TPA: hypothetical protein [Microviridae sp.]
MSLSQVTIKYIYLAECFLVFLSARAHAHVIAHAGVTQPSNYQVYILG